jgi:hypothetical protein
MSPTLSKTETVGAHTPGPLDFVSVGANASGGCHVYMIDANKRKIAALWGKADEKVANAILWSAAPDLLAELQQARHYVKVIADRTTEGRVHEDLARIDAAIAKATGGA